MSTDIVDEPLSESYDFCEAKNTIIVTLYANGAFEVKDLEISIDTDKLDIRTNGKKNFKNKFFNSYFSFSSK